MKWLKSVRNCYPVYLNKQCIGKQIPVVRAVLVIIYLFSLFRESLYMAYGYPPCLLDSNPAMFSIVNLSEIHKSACSGIHRNSVCLLCFRNIHLYKIHHYGDIQCQGITQFIIYFAIMSGIQGICAIIAC